MSTVQEAKLARKREYNRHWRARNPDYQKNWWSGLSEDKRRQYMLTHKATGAQRRNDYRRLYGITPEDYDRMLAEQGGCCAVCGSDKPGGKPPRDVRFHVDHCHVTGKARGLLCVSCNVHIGWLERKQAAVAAYLEKHK